MDSMIDKIRAAEKQAEDIRAQGLADARDMAAGVMLVQGLLVFRAGVRPDRQGGSVAEGESLQAPLDVVELVSLGALHGGVPPFDVFSLSVVY